jgi:thiazole/oxazole-forming peptide maturase SagD family component
MHTKPQVVFFPGKGIYLLPEGRELMSVYKIEDAREIFSHTPSEIYKQIDLPMTFKKRSAITEFPHLEFKVIQHDGTRTFSNSREIDWTVVESVLANKGFVLRKRSYLENAFDGLCPVFYLEHKERGVIAEGKGLTEEQAKRSALAEGVERIFGAEPTRATMESIVIDTYKNLYGAKEWDLGALTGPRDLFSEDILTEWIPAINISRDEQCFLPAELAYFEYIPESNHTRLFSMHHTMGLAAGSSLEDAALSGIFEVIERDAYWITMRCRVNCPDIDIEKVPDMDSRISEIKQLLKSKGFNLVLKDMSLDWGIPVVHAVLCDEKGKIPAFSHGTGASFSLSTAIARAVCEVLQMYSGLVEVTDTNFEWEEVVSVDGVLGKPELAWSDPLYRTHLEHLLTASEQQWKNEYPVNSLKSLLEKLRELGHEVIVADLKSGTDLQVVRVHITNATQPDPRLERMSPRLHAWAEREGLKKGFYGDPILT